MLLPFVAPSNISGATLHLQAAVVDAAAPLGVAMSDVLRLSAP